MADSLTSIGAKYTGMSEIEGTRKGEEVIDEYEDNELTQLVSRAGLSNELGGRWLGPSRRRSLEGDSGIWFV